MLVLPVLRSPLNQLLWAVLSVAFAKVTPSSRLGAGLTNSSATG